MPTLPRTITHRRFLITVAVYGTLTYSENPGGFFTGKEAFSLVAVVKSLADEFPEKFNLTAEFLESVVKFSVIFNHSFLICVRRYRHRKITMEWRPFSLTPILIRLILKTL